MKVFWDKGICVSEGGARLWLDPARKIGSKDALVGISHGHSDHVRPHTARVFATKETGELCAAGSCKDISFDQVGYGEEFDAGGLRVSLCDANHILGSAQFCVENGTRLVYSGDFRLQDSVFGKCAVPGCDVLVVESTYGLPCFRFPAWQQVASNIKQFVVENSRESNVLFGAYSLGKAQELIKILNGFGETPLVHASVARFCKVYERAGVRLDYVEAGTDEGDGLLKDGFVGIVPTRLMNDSFFNSIRFQTRRDVRTALVTGWGLTQSFFGIDCVFALSDHADFFQILDYVKRTGAQRVFTVHGFARELAAELRGRLGVQARSLEAQATLADF